jgi:hypothetical protein
MYQNTPRILLGLAEIGEYLGVSRWTLRRWCQDLGFPSCPRPNGVHITSTTLIAQWLHARKRALAEHQEAMRRAKAGRRSRSHKARRAARQQ